MSTAYSLKEYRRDVSHVASYMYKFVQSKVKYDFILYVRLNVKLNMYTAIHVNESHSSIAVVTKKMQTFWALTPAAKLTENQIVSIVYVSLTNGI